MLSPETLARDIPITDADVQAAYDQHKALFIKPEKRSAEVVSVPDEAKATALAAAWRGGADWAAMQKAAQDAGGSAVALDDATEQEFPDADLGRSVFAAAPDTVSDPAKGALGWHVVRVTKVTPGSTQSFDDVKEEIRSQMLSAKAAELMYDRANKVDNVLGSGARLDEIPSDLGLAGVAGTLDAAGEHQGRDAGADPRAGRTQERADQGRIRGAEGRPAAADRGADAVHRRFSLLRDQVEDVTPPAEKPFDEVKAAGRRRLDARRAPACSRSRRLPSCSQR